jgi:hypothetical protein
MCHAAIPEITLEPTTAFTARSIGGFNGLVGAPDGANGTAWLSTFLDAKESTSEDSSDRVILEYDLRNRPRAVSAQFEINGLPINRPTDPTTLELYAFTGNGLANAADYFRLDSLVTIFDGPATAELSWTLGITAKYNEFLTVGHDFLGLLIRTGVGARYNFRPFPVIQVVVPEPASSLVAISAISVFLTRRRRGPSSNCS